MRTVGVCSHVACIIYFFAHGKYLDYIPSVGGSLLSIFPTNVFQESQTQSIEKIRNQVKQNQKQILKQQIVNVAKILALIRMIRLMILINP